MDHRVRSFSSTTTMGHALFAPFSASLPPLSKMHKVRKVEIVATERPLNDEENFCFIAGCRLCTMRKSCRSTSWTG